MKTAVASVLLLAVVNLYVAHAFLIGGDDWTDLKVTWGINPFGANNFVALPRTEAEAVKAGWTREKDCTQINGVRYVLNGDRATMLLFNADGNIAGIVNGIAKGLPIPRDSAKPYFDDEGDFYSFTAYFMDPAKVCQRSTTWLSTGDRLVFKSKTNEINVAYYEENILADKMWTKGRCFKTMGVHYWPNAKFEPINKDTVVDDILPFFVLYNSGKLNAFGVRYDYRNLTSVRYEHPPPSAADWFFVDTPSFMKDPSNIGGSSIHVFLDRTPHLNFC